MEIDLWSLPVHDYLLGDWPNLTVERLKVYLGFGGITGTIALVIWQPADRIIGWN